MPKVTCLCGECINLSPIPNEFSYLVISEEQYEDCADVAGDRAEGVADAAERRSVVYRAFEDRAPKPEIVECPKCGRLALFRKMSDDIPIWYRLENGSEQAHLRAIYRAKGPSK